MRWFIFVLVLFPVMARAQIEPTPAATYNVTARVTQAIDDEVEGISYLRAGLTIIDMTNKTGSSESPALGPGTTLSAIVRDAKLRAILRSANPSLGLKMVLGWYDESTFQVLSVENASIQTSSSPPKSTVGQVFSDNAQLLLLLVGVAILSFVTLRFLYHPNHGHK